MIYGLSDIARNMIGLSSHSYRLRKGEFWALNDVCFELKKGETLGVIGPNGAGKTTLLKLLNGIFWPDKGKITIKGRVGALIAVGAGFHPLLTGRENIYINGAILGMNKKEIDRKFDEIVDFADIGDFLDVPVNYYSSGMFVRLGFSVAIHCDPDILLIDEILSVGDMAFQRKCITRMNEFVDNGKTIVFVSHNMLAVQSLCRNAIWLEHGYIKSYKDAGEVIKEYTEEENRKMMNSYDQISFDKQVTHDVIIRKVRLIDSDNNPKDRFNLHEKIGIEITYETVGKINSPNIGISIFTSDGIRISYSDTKMNERKLELKPGIGIITYWINSIPLMPGVYTITIGISDGSIQCDLRRNIDKFIIGTDENSAYIISRSRAMRNLIKLDDIWEMRE